MKYVYKIVAALGALATIPMIIFNEIILFRMSSSALQVLGSLAQLLGSNAMKEFMEENGGKAPTGIADTFSLYEIYDLASKANFGGETSLADSLGGVITPLILFGVVCVIVAICAVLAAIFALAAKNNRKVIYPCIAGIGFSFMLSRIFEDFATPIVEGTISLSTLLGSSWGALIGKIETISLTTNFWFIPLVFGAVILWTVLYNYTLPEKEKRERKLMLGEADDE